MPIVLTQKLKAQDLFDSLDREKEQEEDRKIEVRRSKGLDAIIEGYKRAIKNCPEEFLTDICYNICIAAIPKDYTSEDITHFSVIFPEFQVIKAPHYIGDVFSGYYFSALINNCKEDQPIQLEFEHYEKVLWDIGCRNSKKVVLVHGNVYDFLGDKMSGGKIIVNGDAKGDIGYGMSGGEIIVNGDNPYSNIGIRMTRGIIRINGKMGVPNVLRYGGDIYNYNKLVVKNGRLLGDKK